jgi:hypothetical protein
MITLTQRRAACHCSLACTINHDDVRTVRARSPDEAPHDCWTQTDTHHGAAADRQQSAQRCAMLKGCCGSDVVLSAAPQLEKKESKRISPISAGGIDCVVHLGGIPREDSWDAMHRTTSGTYHEQRV